MGHRRVHSARRRPPGWHHCLGSPSTTTLDKPLERTTDNDDTPKMFHYVRKSKIAESAVMGNFVVALCGETFPVTRSPKPDSPVCPDCKKIYESMKKG